MRFLICYSILVYMSSCGIAFISPQMAPSPAYCNGKIDCISSGEARVFLSSTVMTGDVNGALGMTAFNSFCGGLASAAGLTLTYRGFVSDGTTSIKNRLTATGKIYLFASATSAFTLANTPTVLFASGPSHIINITESYGVVSSAFVWTGSFINGNNSGTDCAGWITTVSNGTAGSLSSPTSWLNSGPQACSDSLQVYCFAQRP